MNLKARLARQPYLAGRQITETDWRLFRDAGALRRRVLLDLPLQPPAHCRLHEPEPLPARALRMPGIAATVKPRYYVIGYWSVKKVNRAA